MSAQAYTGPVPCGACARPLPPACEGDTRCVCGASQIVLRFRPFRRAAQPAAAVFEGAQTPCAYHAGNAATSSCGRCGSFVCALCLTPVAGLSLCPPCFERRRRSGGIEGVGAHLPTPHQLALACGLACLLLPWLAPALAPLAFWQAWRTRRLRAELELRDRFVRARALLGALCALLGLGLLGLMAWSLFAGAS